jgi:hypothetical protein
MSDSSIVPERQLVFSPGLAATIGLEEAILLQHLQALFEHQDSQAKNGYAWLSVERDYLLRSLPFWSSVDLHRITRSLTDKGVILMDSPPLHSEHQLIFALNEPIRSQSTARQAPAEPAPQRRSAGLMPANWSPSEEMFELLALNHNIPRQFALDQLEDFVLYWRERGETHHAWENKFRQQVLANWRHHQQQEAQSFKIKPPAPLDSHWQPSRDAMDIMQRSGIDPQFIADAIPEFVLYWRERGDAPKELNSKFIQHIRMQWARFTSSREHSTEPKRISEQFQPSEDTLDILSLCHIDPEFARAMVPEFVLYWRDSNKLHTSWNSKFLQHVKYKWAERLKQDQTRQGHGGQQGSYSTGRTRDRSLADDLNDTSWAD